MLATTLLVTAFEQRSSNAARHPGGNGRIGKGALPFYQLRALPAARQGHQQAAIIIQRQQVEFNPVFSANQRQGPPRTGELISLFHVFIVTYPQSGKSDLMDLGTDRAAQLLVQLKPVLPWLTGAGIALALISLLAIPALIMIMPRDYFVAPRRPDRPASPLRWLVRSLRNGCALILLIAGFLMLFLPGQGLLTLLVGVIVGTFPGKYRLERWLVRWPGVFRSINWIRARTGQPLLFYPTPGGHQDEDTTP